MYFILYIFSFIKNSTFQIVKMFCSHTEKKITLQCIGYFSLKPVTFSFINVIFRLNSSPRFCRKRGAFTITPQHTFFNILCFISYHIFRHFWCLFTFSVCKQLPTYMCDSFLFMQAYLWFSLKGVFFFLMYVCVRFSVLYELLFLDGSLYKMCDLQLKYHNILTQ